MGRRISADPFAGSTSTGTGCLKMCHTGSNCHLVVRDGVCLFFENSTVCRNVSAMFVLCCFWFASDQCGVCSVVGWVSFSVESFNGEFDPGSGRTLAACLTHASRAVRPFRGYTSGERVSNTWVTCPQLWDKPGKLGLIPDRTSRRMSWGGKPCAARDGPAAYQLVGGVMAYQGDDG